MNLKNGLRPKINLNDRKIKAWLREQRVENPSQRGNKTVKVDF